MIRSSQRVLILADAPGVHEARFASALRDEGALVEVDGGSAFGPERLAEACGRFRPDVVQVGPLPFAARLAEAHPRSRVVLVSYGWDVHAAERDGWAGLAGALSRADAAMCDCGATEDALRGRLRPGIPIARFPWGVDLRSFAPDGPRADVRARHGWAASDTVLLSTRRLEPLYDPLTLVDAVAASANRDRLRLIFLGEGSLNSAVLDRADGLGIRDRVVVLPPVPEEDLPPLMRAADIWVNAAHADGASISLLQALACGIPVVTPDLVCAREWADSDVGALYSTGDSAAAAAAVDDVLPRAPRMRPQCRRRAEERADWRIHRRTYAALVFGGDS